MARKRGKGQRTKSGQLSRSLEAMLERNPPNDRVLERRRLFSFVQPPPEKRQDGRNGEIDSEICDGIGQLHALGLLDRHGHDPKSLRDTGREWRNHYTALLRKSGFKGSSYERMDKSVRELRMTGADRRFDAMDEALGNGVERIALMSLLVAPTVGIFADGRENARWVESMVCEALVERGRPPAHIEVPNRGERAMLKAAIRGLLALVDASLPARRERWAA